ncbi:hypothetical protein EB118_13135 [bacterium]|nr:hypothetical protein [bacterium]
MSTQSTDTKNIKIQGGAEIFGGETRKKKTTRSSRTKQGSQMMVPKKLEDGPALTPVPTPAIIMGGEVKLKKMSSGSEVKKISVPPSPSPAPAPPTNQTHTNPTSQPLKVVLKKAQEKDKKVYLKPKKSSQESKNQTRKSRKVTLGIHGLKKRLTKAQHIRKSLANRPIDELKKELVSKGILKAGSKTPDDLVRQIAGDAEIVKGNLL